MAKSVMAYEGNNGVLYLTMEEANYSLASSALQDLLLGVPGGLGFENTAAHLLENREKVIEIFRLMTLRY